MIIRVASTRRSGDSVRTDTRFFNTCTLLTNGVRENCPTATEPVAFYPAAAGYTTHAEYPVSDDPRNPRYPASIARCSKAFGSFTKACGCQFRAEAFNQHCSTLRNWARPARA